MSEPLFDLSGEYEAMLNQGIRLSGENMMFFLEGRLNLLRARMSCHATVSRILDFGCGLGYTSKRLRDMFPMAEITGADTALQALEAARERNSGPGIRFVHVDQLGGIADGFDLCYVNGVFHHIPPEERLAALRVIHQSLRPGGKLALFENNPWNPGARMVMARIPFDRDAQMLSPKETSSLLLRAGFKSTATGSLFFFPRFLKVLRFAEPYLGWTHLGAQYLVLGEKR